MKRLLRFIIIAEIISLGYAVQLQSVLNNQYLDDSFESDLPLDSPNDLRNQASVRLFRKAEHDTRDADKNAKEIESFEILERSLDEEEGMDEEDEEEDLGKNAGTREIAEKKSYFSDRSSELEVEPEGDIDRLPKVLISEEDVGSNQYPYVNEAHRPLIGEGTRIFVNEPLTLPQNQTPLYSESQYAQSPGTAPENYEFNRQTERDNRDLTEERRSYINPDVERGVSDPRPSSSNGGPPRWEEEDGFDGLGPEIEKFVDTSSPIQRSHPNWPTRDMNRLGIQPSHPACRQPLDMGVGPEELPSWYYSYVQGRCHWFAYRGHRGNANRFSSRDACESLCVFEKVNLCSNVRCSYRNSRCTLRGDEECRSWVRRNGGDFEKECPPDQPVCQDRRSIIAPDIDNRLVPSDCFEEYNPGNCLVKTPVIRFYYDPETNSCLGFYFHKCGGNNNRFLSKEDCMNHCSV